MAKYVKIITKSELANGQKKSVVVLGKKIMIANIDGEFFATDDACTHAGCSLGEMGKLKGNVVTCGCHGAQFDVVSGKVIALPAIKNVTSYEVKVEGNDVLVLV